MPKTIIRSIFSGTISTGAFENEKPLFELCEEYDNILPDEQLSSRQSELYALCKGNFVRVQRLSLEEKVKLEQEGIRLYPVVEKNKEYPSVTSITGWDKDFNMPDTELAQYGSRGTLVHKRCEHFDSEPNTWLDLKKLVVEYPEMYQDYVIMTKGNRFLNADGYDYPAFLEKYPIKHLESEKVIYNHDLEYAGRLDKIGIPIMNKNWEKIGVREVETIFDFKTSKALDVDSFGQQASAYAKPLGITQAVIIPLKNYADVKQGFSAPVLIEVEEYFPLFKISRIAFRKRFGI